MNKDDIITLPNENLRKRSKRVHIVTDSVKKLAQDMQDATLSWEDSRSHEVGVALAAVQVDKLQRVIVVRNSFEDKTDRSFQVFINPEIVKLSGEIIEDFEGCLSVKGIYGKVPRYEKIKVKALNLEGQEVRITAEGFLARVLQHEIDHTNGKLFVDHIKGEEDKFYQLKEDGQLEELDYVKDIKNSVLW